MIFGKHINKYYLKFAHFFLLGIIALLVIDYVQLEIPEIIGAIINALENKTLEYEQLIDSIVKLAIIAVLMVVGRFTWRYCIFGTSIKVESCIRDDMFRHAETLSQNYFSKNKTGAQMALYTNDLQTIRMSFGPGIVMLADALFLGVIAYVKMIKLDWVLAILSLVPMLLIAIVGAIVSKFLDKKWEERQKAYENLSDFVQENFSGISVIKAFVKERREMKEFLKHNKDNADKNVEFVKLSVLFDIMLSLTITVTMVIIVGYGGYLVYKNKMLGIGDFSIGQLTEYLSYFESIVWPMMAIAQLISMKSQASASLRRINELLDEKSDVNDDLVLYPDASLNGEIEFNNLSFKYSEDTPLVLKDISFKINNGEHIGIIGRTGCGKTTIVDLLMRVYNVNKGEIKIGGYDIMEVPIVNVRNTVGYVPQDNFLFSDTITKNIAFSKEIADEASVEDAAKYADVHENIIDFPSKYDTVLGERGVTLSGGQKQRISIARAFVKDPEILILDDSVSAVDTKTERTILANLKEKRAGKTTIVIAHRISTIKDMDKIILLEDGELKAFDTHENLLENSSLYREMVELQRLEDEKEAK